MTHVILSNAKNLPLGGHEEKPSRAFENPLAIPLVRERSGADDALARLLLVIRGVAHN